MRVAAVRRMVVALLVLGVIAAVGATYARRALDRAIRQPFDNERGEAVLYEVRRGMTARQVAGELESQGVIRDARVLAGWLRWEGTASRIHAGTFRFDGPMSVEEVAGVLTTGRVALLPVTVPEGSTRWQVAAAIERAGFGTKEDVLEATLEVGLIAELDPSASTLEGYLYPDTYMLPIGATGRDVVAAMVERFRELWTPERRALARDLGLGIREVVTLASLIEAEAQRPHERVLISGVFHNRLERGMLLQCDPTLLYALRIAGRRDRNIRRGDFVLDSPYNTYRYSGLPAGPIGNPRAASLDAALDPADVGYLYFVARNDGSHVFSRTLREHNQMVNRYQR